MKLQVDYNSVSFQADYVKTRSSDHFDMPEKSVHDIQYLMRDGGARTGSRFASRVIKIIGYVTELTPEDLTERLDIIKQALGDKQTYELQIEDDEGVRVWPEVEADNFQLQRIAGSYGEFTVSFYCFDPIARAEDFSTYSNDNITSVPETDTVTFTGTYGPSPTITIDVVDVGNITSIFLKNNENSQEIEIPGIGSDGDNVIINTEAQTIILNGEEVEGIGKIPNWLRGANSYTLTAEGSGSLLVSQDQHDGQFGFQYGTIYEEAAQKFNISGSGSIAINQIKLLLEKWGTQRDGANVKVSIETDSAGEPSGTTVTNSDIDLNTGDIQSGYNWMTLSYSTAPSITKGTDYWLVIEYYYSYIDDQPDDFAWRKSTTDVYASGNSAWYDGSSWTQQTSHDFCWEFINTSLGTIDIDIEFLYYPRYL